MKTAALNSWQLLLGLSILVSYSTLHAQAKVFDGEIGSEWNEPANWDPNGVPMSGETATITNGLTAMITGASVPSVARLEIGIGGTPGGLSMNGGGNLAMLEVLSEVAIGQQGELEVGLSSAHLLGSELQNQGDVIVSTGGQIIASSQYVQDGGETLLFGGTINTPTMRINSGELGGFGQINGDMKIGLQSPQPQPATISPGIGIGDLAINGDLELTRNAEFVVEVEASGPSVRADELSVTGTVTLGGTLDVREVMGTLTPGNKVVFLVAGNVEPGTFFDEIIGTEIETELFVGYEPSRGGGFNVYVAAIPEPSTLVLAFAAITAGCVRGARALLANTSGVPNC